MSRIAQLTRELAEEKRKQGRKAISTLTDGLEELTVLCSEPNGRGAAFRKASSQIREGVNALERILEAHEGADRTEDAA